MPSNSKAPFLGCMIASTNISWVAIYCSKGPSLLQCKAWGALVSMLRLCLSVKPMVPESPEPLLLVESSFRFSFPASAIQNHTPSVLSKPRSIILTLWKSEFWNNWTIISLWLISGFFFFFWRKGFSLPLLSPPASRNLPCSLALSPLSYLNPAVWIFFGWVMLTSPPLVLRTLLRRLGYSESSGQQPLARSTAVSLILLAPFLLLYVQHIHGWEVRPVVSPILWLLRQVPQNEVN